MKCVKCSKKLNKNEIKHEVCGKCGHVKSHRPLQKYFDACEFSRVEIADACGVTIRTLDNWNRKPWTIPAGKLINLGGIFADQNDNDLLSFFNDLRLFPDGLYEDVYST